jgi:hypothetical protein
MSVSMLLTLARHSLRHRIAIHLALRSFVDECRGVTVRLIAYVGTLALIAIAATRLWAELPVAGTLEPATRAGWSVATRSYPAFAVSQVDSLGKIETYDIFRHPEGGRRDVLRWAASSAEKPVAELELYRPGAEVNQVGPPANELAARMDPERSREITSEGMIDSKFGPIALLGLIPHDPKRCLGFMKDLGAANLRISGWSCQGETLPARRSAIACTLDRLILLTAGNDPKLAELFARAELKRGNCSPASAATALSSDWVTGAQNPRLRGSL